MVIIIYILIVTTSNISNNANYFHALLYALYGISISSLQPLTILCLISCVVV